MRYAKTLLSAVLIGFHPITAVADDLESKIKATYIDKFSLYVEWPSETAEFPGGNFTICVVGVDEVGELLFGLNGQKFDGHPIVVKNARSQCSVLYAAGSDGFVAANLAAVAGNPVLTVTNEAKTPDTTGIINLVLADDHVRFAVNIESASRNKLQLSSKLLSIAMTVH